MKNVLTLIVVLLIATIAALFAFQNSQPMDVVFYKWKFESVEAVILLMAMGIGVIMTLLAFIPSRMARSIHIASLKSKLKKSEKACEQHKTEHAKTTEEKTKTEKELEDIAQKKAKTEAGIEEINAE